MANEQPKRVTLKLDGPRITSDKFLHAVRAFFGVVDEVTSRVAGKARALSWVVTVEDGSDCVVMTPEPTQAMYRDAVDSVLSALSAGGNIIEDTADTPPFFSDTALEKMRELASIVDPTGASVDTVQILVTNQEPVALSRHAVANVDDILRVQESAVVGSVEGTLEILNAHDGFKFSIYQDVTGHRVTCYVEPDMVDEVTAGFRKRVSVQGLLGYRRSGELASVKVKRFRVLTQENLPSWEDVKGILGDR